MTMRSAQATRFWCALGALVALNVGGWIWVRASLDLEPLRPLVRLVHVGGESDLRHRGRLPLVFDRDLFEQSLVGDVLIESPFLIEPPVAGSWRVKRRNEISFEPVQEPPPGLIYRVRTVPGHAMLASITLGGINLPEIRYRPLRLLHTRIGDVALPHDGSAHELLRDIKVELEFNQDVAPRSLKDAVHCWVDGRSVEVEVHSESTGEKHALLLQASLGSRIELELDKDLHGPGASLGLGARIERKLNVKRGLKPGGTRSGFYRSGSAWVKLRFDRQLEVGQRIPEIKVDPPIEGMRVEQSLYGITLLGDFKPETTYAITLTPPLLAADGTVLQHNAKYSVWLKPRRPELSFVRSSGRLTTEGTFSLDLHHHAVQSVKLTIDRLLERNLPLYLAGLDSTWNVKQFGERIATETIELPPTQDARPRKSLLELDQFIPRTPGIYVVSLSDTNSRWRHTRSLVLVSDLALHVQRDATGLLAWATSVRTGQPVPGTRLVAWASNRRELAEAVTDAEGIARIEIPGNSPVDLVTATNGEEHAFLHPHQARKIDDSSLFGVAWSGPLDATLYAERGVHRPGEPIHLTGIVRTRDGATVGGMPLEVRMRRPDGRVMVRETVTTEEDQGVFHLTIETDASAPTGNWVASCHLQGDEEDDNSNRLATLTCPIMPFVPVRLALEASLEEREAGSKEPFRVDVSAHYLHGAPAASLAAHGEAIFTAERYSDPAFPDFLFEDQPHLKRTRMKGTVTLDARGMGTIELDLPKTPGSWRAVIETTVLEAAGRATTRHLVTSAVTAEDHLGIRLPGFNQHVQGEPIPLEAVLLTTSSNPKDEQAGLSVRMLSIDRHWSLLEDSRGKHFWRLIETTDEVRGLDVNFTTSSDDIWRCTLPTLPPGAYRVEVVAHTKRPLTATKDFQIAWGTAHGRLASDRIDRLELIPTDETITPGTSTNVLLRSPFPGLALVTVETDRILSTMTVPIEGDDKLIAVRIPEEVRDTCFIGATVVRPLDPTHTEWLPVRAQGAVRLRVDRAPHKLDVSITASDGARPGENIFLMIAAPECMRLSFEGRRPLVHVWAVEEGALLVTKYHAPQLVNRFLRDRRRTVASIDTISQLLPDYARPASMDRIGGDLASGYRTPVPVRLRQTAVLWRKTVTLDEDGLLELDMEMPDIDGALRVMAVVIDGDRYGRAEHAITVTSPLRIEAVLPRAAAPGDRMDIPVRLLNRTSAPIQLALELTLPRELEGSLTRNRILVPAHGSASTNLKLQAIEPGSAVVAISAQAHGAMSTRFMHAIAVRPPLGRQHEIIRLRVPGESTIQIERDHSLEALSGRVEVLVGGTPILDLRPALDDLIEYPYGCAEQTGSRTRGLLAARMLPPEIVHTSPEVLDLMIQSGIRRLWKMQRSDGSIAYWPGGSRSDWATLESGLIALDARDSGYNLPGGFLEGIVTHAQRTARPSSGNADPLLGAIACRILARVGKPDLALMRTLESRGQDLPLDGRAHLGAAYACIGRPEDARRLFDELVLPGVMAPRTSGSFTSDTWQVAIALDALLRHQPDHPRTVEFARMLHKSQNQNGWRTTYENAGCLMALTRWHMSLGEPGTTRGTLNIAGRTIQFEGNELKRASFAVSDVSGELEFIETTGKGTAHLVVITSGIPAVAKNEQPRARGISITRKWFDPDGTEITKMQLEAGELVIVELEFHALGTAEIPNVAITDVLPGGMEFELPSLATSAGSDKVELSEVDRAEFHDERLLIFTTLNSKPQRVRYVMRTIVPGTWHVPAPTATAMYDQELHARGATSRLEILAP